MSFLTVQELEYSVSVPAVMNILFWHSGHPLISLILGPNHTAWAPQAHALDTNRPNMYILTLLEQKHKPNEEKIKLKVANYGLKVIRRKWFLWLNPVVVTCLWK